MWLVTGINAADVDDPQPGTVIAGRIEADHLGAKANRTTSTPRRATPAKARKARARKRAVQWGYDKGRLIVVQAQASGPPS
jgi:hypothetical protein